MTPVQKIRDFLDSCAGSAGCDAAYAALAELEASFAVHATKKTPTIRETLDRQAPVMAALATIERAERERDEVRTEVDRLRAEMQRRDEQILKLSTAILPTSEPAEQLVAELLAAARQAPTTSRRLQPANPHPSGCHTEAPGSRDCNSDGHESCLSCSRRRLDDQLKPAWPADPWPSDEEEQARMRAGRSFDP